MLAIIGLVLMGLVAMSLYYAARFLISRDNRYGRRMIYSVVTAMVMIGAIVWM